MRLPGILNIQRQYPHSALKESDSCHMRHFYWDLNWEAMLLGTAPAPLPSRKIEVFGDSVSCGEVSEAVDYAGKPDPEHDGGNIQTVGILMRGLPLGICMHSCMTPPRVVLASLENRLVYGSRIIWVIESCYDKIENTSRNSVK